ncbi:DUF6527 family protein [Armatimonas sp.]|uniref:DUF6527 family protein n=1 Tax=Armatimonas sp. TaxID=1872638 RepID=UPI0037521554
MRILSYSPTEWVVIDPRYPATSPTAIRTVQHVPKSTSKARWEWNGDVDFPTITPSVNESWGPIPESYRQSGEPETGRNHYIITAGRIQYCGDCTHSFAGQTQELPCFTEAEVRFYLDRVKEQNL